MILAQMSPDVRRDVEQPIRSNLSFYGSSYSLAVVSDAIGAAFERRATTPSLRSSLVDSDSLGSFVHVEPAVLAHARPTCSKCSAWSCPRATDEKALCDVMDWRPQSYLDTLSPPAYKGWVERQRAKISKGEKPSHVQLVHGIEKAYEMDVSAPTCET